MPPPVDLHQQDAAQRYRSPYAPESGSSATSAFGSESSGQSSRQSSLPAQIGSTFTGYGNSSNFHAHPDASLNGGSSSSHTPLHRNAPAPASLSQSTLSNFGYGYQAQRPGKTAIQNPSSASKFDYRSNASASHSHGSSLSNNGTPRVKSQKPSAQSRFDYPDRKKQETSYHQLTVSSNGHGNARKDIPTAFKAPFRGSANKAYQSQYQQSPLQYSVTPDRLLQASPQSQLQIVISTRSPIEESSLPPLSGLERHLKSPHISCGSNETPKIRSRHVVADYNVKKIAKRRGRPPLSAEAIKMKAGKAAIELAMKKAEKAARKAQREAIKAKAKKNGLPQPYVAQPEPIFHPFICEWDGCGRELQNLETLRRHVYLMHKKRSNEKIMCLWGKCGKEMSLRTVLEKPVDKEIGAMDIDGTENVAEAELADKPKTTCPAFGLKQDWLEHLEEKHFIPFAWHMGEGPKATDLCKPSPLELRMKKTLIKIKQAGQAKGEINPLWLNDSSGVQVTPSVVGQPIEAGRVSDNNAKRFRKMEDAEKYKIKQPKELQGMAMAPPIIASSEDDDTGVDGEAEDTGMEDVATSDISDSDDIREALLGSEFAHDERDDKQTGIGMGLRLVSP